MKVFKNWAVVCVILLFFVAVLSCENGEESLKVDLDKRTSDVSRLVKTTDMGKSLKFCFDRRLDPLEEIKIYGSFLDYLEKETGLDFMLLFSEDYQETIKNISTGKAQFAIIGDASAGGIQEALAFSLEKDESIRIIALSDYSPRSAIAVNKDVPEEIANKVKTALLQFDPAGKHKDGLINWDKTEMSGGFSDDVVKKIAEKYRLLGDD